MLIALAAAFLAAEEPPPTPAVAAALQAWGECVNEKIDRADRGLSPDRAADAVLAECASLQQSLLAEHARWLESSTLSDAAKRRARRSMDRSLATLRGQVARGIRMMRDD
jgi:hypothetical protein